MKEDLIYVVKNSLLIGLLITFTSVFLASAIVIYRNLK